MKLKSEFTTYKTGQSYVSVTEDEDEEALNGMVRNNETADFIFEQLKKETTEAQIVDALMEAYDVDVEVAKKDVHKVIETWREEGLLDE